MRIESIRGVAKGKEARQLSPTCHVIFSAATLIHRHKQLAVTAAAAAAAVAAIATLASSGAFWLCDRQQQQLHEVRRRDCLRVAQVGGDEHAPPPRQPARLRGVGRCAARQQQRLAAALGGDGGGGVVHRRKRLGNHRLGHRGRLGSRRCSAIGGGGGGRSATVGKALEGFEPALRLLKRTRICAARRRNSRSARRRRAVERIRSGAMPQQQLGDALQADVVGSDRGLGDGSCVNGRRRRHQQLAPRRRRRRARRQLAVAESSASGAWRCMWRQWAAVGCSCCWSHVCVCFCCSMCQRAVAGGALGCCCCVLLLLLLPLLLPRLLLLGHES